MVAYSWLNGVSGDWSTAVDWSRGVPNSTAANVTIAAIGLYTVDIGTGESFTTGNLTLNDASATLRIDGTLNLTGTLTLSAGTLNLDGAINGGTIATKSGIFTVTQGVLNGVTCEGEIRLTAPSSSLTVVGGLTTTGTRGTGSGTIKVTGYGGALNFEGTQTLDNATILFGSNTSTGYATLDVFDNGSAATLTLGKNVNVVGSQLYAQIDASSPDAAVVNDGAISATAKGGQFTIGSAFTNNGSVSVSNGDMLTIASPTFTNGVGATLTAAAGSTLAVGHAGSSWSNAGTITATNATVVFNGAWTNTGAIDVTNSTVNLGASLTGATLNQFAGQGNSIVISGSVANKGNVLSVGAGTGLGAVALDGGTITGGTIADSGGGLSFKKGTLDGVAYHGALDLSGQSSSLTIDRRIALTGAGGTGAGTANLTGAGSSLVFAGNQTMNNATINFGSSDGSGYAVLGISDNGAPAVLILGQNLNIVGSGLYAKLYSTSPDATIINDGAISATASGGQFDVGGGALALVNYGSLSVSNGDTLTINPNTFANAAGATIGVAAGSTLAVGNYDGSWVNSGTITATNAAVSFSGVWTNAGTLEVTNSTVTLGGNSRHGSITVATLNMFAGQGNSIVLGGKLANGGNVLSVGAGTTLGAITLKGGTIAGGTIADSGGGLSFNNGALNGVAYQGTLDLSADNSQLTIDNGITLTGTGGAGAGTINLIGTGSSLDFVGSQTLDNATIIFGSNGYATLKASGAGSPATLTLGENLNVVVSGPRDSIHLAFRKGSYTTIVNDGAISATAGGRFSIEGNGAFTNNGSLLASNGERFFVLVNDFTNLSSTTLTGGKYEADAGAVIGFLNEHGRIVTDDATIILNGAGSIIEDQNYIFDNTLTTIGAAGVLELLGGRNFTTTAAFTDSGALVLGGGTFTAGGLNIGAGGSIAGRGAVATTVADSGLIEAKGGTLTLQMAVTGIGALKIDAGATLTLGSTLAAGGTATFNGGSAILAITAVSSFGDTIGGLAATDEIDLIKTAATSAVLNGSNQLVVTNNGAAVVTLQLSGDNSGLAFSTASDGNGGTFIVASAAPAAVPQASLSLFGQFVAAGFGPHAAPLMDRQDHLAITQPHLVLAAQH